ncbi:hypothetical protein M501DRAFT_726598 [Patellaria atrata CBS 101060]|uniref:F-box domain-containing protein n=1 Tax=Patellaria atrata CBS 101060 TaxID=1346257 RepID=A0A9P4SBY8_9PEZI|nr:hypothetical protein M501DRAFT_726598 [Patellaria atrata CBS 101060]
MASPIVAATTSSSRPLFRILNTVELLEALLLSLPPADIVRCRLVCQHFNTVITSSPQLQHRISTYRDIKSDVDRFFQIGCRGPYLTQDDLDRIERLRESSREFYEREKGRRAGWREYLPDLRVIVGALWGVDMEDLEDSEE